MVACFMYTVGRVTQDVAACNVVWVFVDVYTGEVVGSNDCRATSLQRCRYRFLRAPGDRAAAMTPLPCCRLAYKGVELQLQAKESKHDDVRGVPN